MMMAKRAMWRESQLRPKDDDDENDDDENDDADDYDVDDDQAQPQIADIYQKVGDKNV